MSVALTKALSRNRGLSNSAHQQVLNLKGMDMGGLMAPMDGGFGLLQNVAKTQRRYNQFRGWLYSAVNVLASEAAGQPVMVGKFGGSNSEGKPNSTKDYILSKMTKGAFSKASREELEIVNDPVLMDQLDRPNPIQYRWQFVYSFVASLNLTGWAYIIKDVEKDRPVFYSLPSTWIRPDHKKGPYSRFYIVNPSKPASMQGQIPLDRTQVGFAYLPDPSNPMAAIAPSSSQDNAIRIDEHIQSSQEVFFENGIFPGVVVTIGKDPHPNVPAGLRPRLTGPQRRQITGAIKKVMGGISNYGNPAIIDGLIESITRFTASQNEMGWEKSEGAVRTRILSAFALHPYLMGEPVSIGGYAQVANIEKRFYKRVNTFLDMLGVVMTGLINQSDSTDNLLVWWEKCKEQDAQLELKLWEMGRSNNDMTRNEWRAKVGLPPAEDIDAKKNKLLETVGGINGAVAIFTAVGQGAMSSASAAKLLAKFFDIPIKEAIEIVGTVPPKQQEPTAPVIQEAVVGLEKAINALGKTYVDFEHRIDAIEEWE